MNKDGFVNDRLSDDVKEKLEKGMPAGEALDMIQEDLEKQGILDDEANWMLVRKRDGLTKKSKAIKWVDGDNRELTDDLQVGRWLVMSPFNEFFTWKTSPITEILIKSDNLIHFKTGNSEYKLYKGNDETFDSDGHRESIREWRQPKP